MKVAVVTGCSGLVGCQAVDFLHKKGFFVVGIDNHMRGYFFGDDKSTINMTNTLLSKYDNFKFFKLDIREFEGLKKIFSEFSSDIELIIHTAAQPSHDWAAREPITDFTINANGTLNLLESFRSHCKNATFIYVSTNKVYGDRPNLLNLTEDKTRFEFYENGNLSSGIDENMNIDNSTHSLFGVSKLSGDLLAQEYGKYFGLNVGIFRGGCLTGPNHQGAQLHGFLSYLVKCVKNNLPYEIIGYNGKQVRDNIHSFDLVNSFWCFHKNPKKGEVYNIGGGRENSVSVLEAIKFTQELCDIKNFSYTINNQNRIGDHIWYISNLSKFKKDYPDWDLTKNLKQIIIDIINE